MRATKHCRRIPGWMGMVMIASLPAGAQAQGYGYPPTYQQAPGFGAPPYQGEPYPYGGYPGRGTMPACR